MNIYFDLTPSRAPSAVALGCFDGLHIGHQKVIAAAREEGLTPTVVTFDSDFSGDLGFKAGGALVTRERKLRLMEGLGVEQVYILQFSAVRDFSPEQFVEEILAKVCQAQKVCCGFNFTFGKGGAGKTKDLNALCATRNIRTEIVAAVLSGEETVSSTRIRALVARGEVREAAKLLGRPFGYDFRVEHGRRLGRTLGAPTANQYFPDGFLLPRFGVYASVVEIGGQKYCGVTDVGVKPTVGSPRALSETWIPGYSGAELYGSFLPVELMAFLRPEEKFESLDELKDNILRDGEHARAALEEMGAGLR